MRAVSSKFIAVILCVLLTACATVIHEKKQKVTINSVPEGATLTIDGKIYLTPATVPLNGKSEYYFTLTKPGYQPATGKVDGEFRIWSSVVGNIFNLTGVIGLAVDLWGSGNAFELEKDNTVTLIPLPPTAEAPIYPATPTAAGWTAAPVAPAPQAPMAQPTPAYAVPAPAPAPAYTAPSYAAPMAPEPVTPMAPLPDTGPTPTGAASSGY